jgi:hypothetical protein
MLRKDCSDERKGLAVTHLDTPENGFALTQKRRHETMPAVRMRMTNLVAGGSAVVADDEAGDIYRFEVRQREAGDAGEVVVVPARVGGADQAAAVTVVGEDDAVVAEGGDEDLWASRALRARW